MKIFGTLIFDVINYAVSYVKFKIWTRLQLFLIIKMSQHDSLLFIRRFVVSTSSTEHTSIVSVAGVEINF